MKRRLDKEMIISLAVISAIASLGIMFFLLFLFDIQVSAGNLPSVMGAFSLVSSIVWLILLCRNC